MIISIPRALIVGLAAVFSAYHVLLAFVSIGEPRNAGPYVAAMVIYAVVTTLSLWPSKRRRMPLWLAIVNVVASGAIGLLVIGQMPDGPGDGDGYAAWFTAAIGTLMVITSTRGRQLFAWIGVGALVVVSVAWVGFDDDLIGIGTAGSVLWVGIAHAISHSLASAGRDARQYALAEREAVEWRAAQDAHLFERQFRLGQTSRMAIPMLTEIAASGGELTEEQRRECIYLEGGIRDEIRGRKLLNDAVRAEVLAARRRGTIVTLLDEGGIDDVDEVHLDGMLNQLAEAIRVTRTDRIIARTVPRGGATAITVVGLSSANQGTHSALGHEPDDEDEDEIDLWLEIPRTADAMV